MIEQVRNFLKENNIYNTSAIVGFSSGPDSCALALILNKLKEEFRLKLILAYFNHNWRKEASEEENFTVEFARKIDCDFYLGKANDDVKKTEESARIARYEFFKNASEKFETDIVFLAHNKNDNIETLIYRIIKGTGVRGLCSIPVIRDIYYRPLLNVSKEEILKFLKDEKIKFMYDSSNDDVKYKRNLIRKEILPLFEKINPNYLTNIETLITNANFTKNILDEQLFKMIDEIVFEDSFFRDKYLSYSTPLRYEFLNYFVGDKLKYRNFKNIKKIDDFILNNQSSQISINREMFLKIKKNKIFYVQHNNYD